MSKCHIVGNLMSPLNYLFSAIQTEKLQQLLKDIDLAWNNLAAFLVGGSIMVSSIFCLEFNDSCW